MNCKHCGQKMKKQTYYDMLKLLFEGGLEQEDWNKLFCGRNCPFEKMCESQGKICFMSKYEEWLRKEIKP